MYTADTRVCAGVGVKYEYTSNVIKCKVSSSVTVNTLMFIEHNHPRLMEK